MKRARHVNTSVSNTDLTLPGQSYGKAHATFELVLTMKVRDIQCVSVGNEYSVTPSCNTDQGVHADTQAHGVYCQVHNKHYGWVNDITSHPQFMKKGMRVSAFVGTRKVMNYI